MNREYVIIAVAVIFAFFLVLVEPSYIGYAVTNLNINLTTSNYGPNQPLDGKVDFSFTNLPSETKIVASIDGTESKLNLKDQCNNCNIIHASYNLVQLVSSAQASFNDAGFNDSYAIGFVTASTSPTMDIANFSVGGQPINNIYPKLPGISIAGKANWSYIGPLIPNQFEDIPANYLFSYNADGQYDIRGIKADEYCEKITFTPSSYYKIDANVQKYPNSGADLRARLRNLDKSIAQNSTGNDAYCSIAASTSVSWSSCFINITNKENTDYYACIYAENGDGNTPYYKISYEKPDAVYGGMYCSSDDCTVSVIPQGTDYFIGAARNKFITNLSTTLEIDLKDELSNTPCTARVTKDSTLYCLYPVRIASQGRGIVTLSIPSGKLKTGPISGNLYSVNSVPESLDKGDVEINLADITNLLTPSAEGAHNLKVELVYNGNVYSSKEALINVTSVTTPTIQANSLGYVYQNIGFKASVSGNKTAISSYEWNFGDTFIATTLDPNVSHAYNAMGNYTVSLVAVDINNMRSLGTNFTIVIGSVQRNVEFLINDTKSNLDRLSSQITSADENAQAVIKLLHIDNDLSNATASMSQYKLDYNSALSLADAEKETSLATLQSNLLKLRSKVPRSLNVQGFSFPSTLDFVNDIPNDVINAADKQGYKESILEFQKDVSVTSKGYNVNLDYISGNNDKFMLVKKDVSTTKRGDVIEAIPKEVASSIQGSQILTEGYTIVRADPIIKWPITSSIEIAYKLAANNLENLIKTKTFVIPKELVTTEEAKCGNGICERPFEDEISCPEDCKPKIPFGIYIPLLLVLIAGIYYINFYKGPGNFKDLSNLISVKLIKKRIFTSKEDLAKLVSYIKRVRAQGLNEAQITETLSKKGWKKEQIDYALKEAKK